MKNRPLKTVLVGFGKIASGAAVGERQRARFPYASHWDVLKNTAEFELLGAVDVSPEARATANKLGIEEVFESVESAAAKYPEVDLLVLATPPHDRLKDLSAFSSIGAVLIEKPVGESAEDSKMLEDFCKKRNILAAVNYWRRAEPSMLELAQGGLERKIGKPQVAYVCYGNGCRNNGSHMIDLVRMLLGEVKLRGVHGHAIRSSLPIQNDSDISFSLETAGGCLVHFSPLDFSDYRENSLVVYGSKGLLSIVHEGLDVFVAPVALHRALDSERELAFDQQEHAPTQAGTALKLMYDNLRNALLDGTALQSPLASAVKNEHILSEIFGAIG